MGLSTKGHESSGVSRGPEIRSFESRFGQFVSFFAEHHCFAVGLAESSRFSFSSSGSYHADTFIQHPYVLLICSTSFPSDLMESNQPGPFIKTAFSPTVLVIANQDVEDICRKNGADVSLTSILEACGATVPASRGTTGGLLLFWLVLSSFALFWIFNTFFLFQVISSFHFPMILDDRWSL